MTRLLRLSLLAAACVVWASLPAAADTAANDPDAEEADALDSRSLSGSYLAGRFAEGRRDVDAAARYLKRALELDPNAPDLRRRALLLNVMAGRIEAARELADEMAGEEAAEPFSNLLLAALAIHDGNPERALALSDHLADSGLAVYVKPLVVAWAEVAKEDRKAADAALTPLSGVQGATTLYNLHRALIAEVFGDQKEAEKFYRVVTSDTEELSLRSVQLLGNLLERTGRAEEAKALYQRFVDAHPGTSHLKPALDRIKDGGTAPTRVTNAGEGLAEGLFGIASSLERQDAGDTALVLGRIALALKPEFPLMRYLVAGVLDDEGRHEEAIALYRTIPETAAVSWTSRLRIARALDTMGRVEEASAVLKELAAERPDDSTPVIALGDLMRGEQRWDEAVAAYDDAVTRSGELTKDDWRLLYSRGIALERAGEWPRAEADFLKALEFEPDQPFVLNYLGYSWIEKGMHLERAQQMIQKAVQARPNDGYIVDSLGWGYYMLGDYQNAVRELERAVELRPHDPIINDHLGDAYWRAGRQLEATFQWNHSLSLGADEKLRAEIERKLEEGLVKAVTVQPAAGAKKDGG